MQATFSVPRSRLTMAGLLAALLTAILLGGVGGYAVRGALGASSAHPESVAGATNTASLAESHSSAYVQGGRPAIVYAPEPPRIYVQGGRPQVVYDEAARLTTR